MKREAKWLAVIKYIVLMMLLAVIFFCGRGTALSQKEPSTPAPPVFSENTDEEEALEVAEHYLEAAPYSEEGLTQALVEYEHFEKNTASEAVKNTDTDWQEQAKKAVELHLNSDGITEKQLREYMKRDKFTDEQTEEAITAVDPDWQEQANMKKEALLMGGVDEENINAVLLSQGFAPEYIRNLD